MNLALSPYVNITEMYTYGDNLVESTYADISACSVVGRDTETVDLAELVDRVPEGWTAVVYGGRRWGMSRTSRASGRSIALYAEELSGSEVVSANVYRTERGDQLRPCEMPAEDVLDFLREWEAFPPA